MRRDESERPRSSTDIPPNGYDYAYDTGGAGAGEGAEIGVCRHRDEPRRASKNSSRGPREEPRRRARARRQIPKR